MLSQDIRLLKIWFDCQWEVHGGVGDISADGAAEFSRRLGEAVTTAQALETTAIAQAVRLTKAQLADPNILPFPSMCQRVSLQGGDLG